MRLQAEQKKSNQVWHIASRLLLMLGGVFCLFTLSFGIFTWLSAWLNWHPSAYLNEMTTMGITFFLLVITGITINRLLAPRNRILWQTLFDALRHMSKGNFDVRLDVELPRELRHEEHPFHVLVHSINDMAHELAQIEKMRQEFISDVSHEIQSPLTSIQGFASALRRGDLSAEQQDHYLAIIEDESKRLSRLSDNLLKLTSLESGYHPFQSETYRLDRQLRDIILACEPAWSMKKIQIHFDVSPVELVADKDLLSQVWVNLLSNAIKFTAEQGEITVSINVSDEWADVHIADTGIGMSAEDVERVFERFYKSNKSRGGSGAGLGLSIVKKIIDLHRGKVQACSSVGAGSTFTVSLPLSTNQLPQ